MAKLQKPKNKSKETKYKPKRAKYKQKTEYKPGTTPWTRNKIEDGRCETQVHKGNTKQQTHGNRADEEREDKDLNTQGMINWLTEQEGREKEQREEIVSETWHRRM